MTVTAEMVREAEAHFPLALRDPPSRWQWYADFYNRALAAPDEPCPCCNVTPDGDVLDHLSSPPIPSENEMTDTASRFTVSADSLTVHEPARDLHWTRDDVSPDTLTFDQAEAAVAKLNADKFGGFDDWRLPSVEELFLLADRTKEDPAIDAEAFPTCKPTWYWTGTLDAEDPSEFAWIVSFYHGGSAVDDRNDGNRVRAVRGSSRQ